MLLVRIGALLRYKKLSSEKKKHNCKNIAIFYNLDDCTSICKFVLSNYLLIIHINELFKYVEHG